MLGFPMSLTRKRGLCSYDFNSEQSRQREICRDVGLDTFQVAVSFGRRGASDPRGYAQRGVPCCR